MGRTLKPFSLLPLKRNCLKADEVGVFFAHHHEFTRVIHQHDFVTGLDVHDRSGTPRKTWLKLLMNCNFFVGGVM